MKTALISALSTALLSLPAQAAAPQAAATTPATTTSISPAAKPDAQPTAAPHAGHQHAHGHPQMPLPATDKASQEAMNAMTEAKLTGLATYLRALLNDESDEAALRKSKLDLPTLDSLAFLSERYYPARAKVLEFEAELARLKAAPQGKAEAARARSLQQMIGAHERFRGQFFQQVKAENRALIDKHEPTFVALVREQKVKRAKIQAESVELVRKNFDESLMPRFIAYLSARAAKVSERQALATAKIEEKQAIGLSQLVSEYGRQKMTARQAEKELPAARQRLKAAQTGGRSTSFEERLIQHYESQLTGFESFKASFAQKNGAKLQAAIEANFDALMAAYQRQASQPGGAR